MRRCLAEGHPIVFGLKLTQRFFQPRQGYCATPDPNDPQSASHGLHAMLLVGYNDRQSIFIVRNSWGTSWGDQGYGYLVYWVKLGEHAYFLPCLLVGGRHCIKIWQYRETRGIHPQSWGSALISCRYRFYLNLCQPSSNLNFTSPSLTKDTCPTTTSPVRSSTLGASMPSKASLRSAGGTANVVHVVLLCRKSYLVAE